MLQFQLHSQYLFISREITVSGKIQTQSKSILKLEHT